MAIVGPATGSVSRRPAWGLVWLTGLRDLQWRRRRVLMAVLGTALVFALTLLLSAFRESFDREADRTAEVIEADHYYLPEGLSGPFSGVAPIPAESVALLAGTPGITEVSPMILVAQVLKLDGEPQRTFVIGHEPGKVGSPFVSQGRAPEVSGEAAVDASTGLAVGDTLLIGANELEVVGRTKGYTLQVGAPHVYLTLADAQALVFNGLPFVTTIAVEGRAESIPAGLAEITPAETREDILRPVEQATGTISLLVGLLWVVAAAIIGLVLYLSTLEREGDFAVFKATGVADVDLVISLVVQAMVLALLASVVAIGAAFLLKPLFPIELVLTGRLLATAPIVAVIVGSISSVAGLRRVVRIDPALAFE